MKPLTMKNLTILFTCLLSFLALVSHSIAQQSIPKKDINEAEKALIQQIFNEIDISDQLYRGPLAKGTLDKKIIQQIDSVFDNEGIHAGIKYRRSLNLSIPKVVKDSLWNLQAAIDLRNHLMMRGIWETYGFIPKDLIEENQDVQVVVLFHPPRDWDMRTYLREYSALLVKEVKAGRMPARTYALFYDNIKGKILKEPQLYGTNQRYSTKKQKVLPPLIDNIEKTNAARLEIGLMPLKEGEYELAE